MKKYLAWIPALVIHDSHFLVFGPAGGRVHGNERQRYQSAFVDGGGCGAYGPGCRRSRSMICAVSWPHL